MQDDAARGGIAPKNVSVKDAALYVGISSWSMYQLLNAGEVESTYYGRRRLVDVKSLEAYANALPTTPGDAA